MNDVEGQYFIRSLRAVADQCFMGSESKGFWNDDPTVGTVLQQYYDTTKLMLVVTEIAEAVEGLRHGNPKSDKIPEFSAVEEELADAFIRMADLWHKRGWRVPEAIVAKLAYNASRPHKHGKGF